VADTSAGRRSLKRASDTPCLVAPWLSLADTSAAVKAHGDH